MSSVLEEVIIGDSTFNVDVIEAITSFEFDLRASAQTELTLEIVDPDFKLLAANVFQRKQTMVVGDLKCEIAVVEAGDTPSPQGLSIKARSFAVQKFKRTKTAIVRRNISPTDFLSLEAALVGATVVGQPSTKRAQIARVNTEDKQESTWDVMNTLANELGYLFFESAGVFYFGQPSWLVARPTKWTMDWPGNDDPSQIVILGVPSCRASEDSKDGASIDLVVDRTTGVKVRPGDPVIFTGVPQFSGTYMVDSVGWDALQPSEPVSVSLVTPIDPETKTTKKSKKAVAESDGPAALLDQTALQQWEASS